MSKKDYVRTIARNMLVNILDLLILTVQIGLITKEDSNEIAALLKDDIAERIK